MPQAPRSASATAAPSCALPVTLAVEEGATCAAFLSPGSALSACPPLCQPLFPVQGQSCDPGNYLLSLMWEWLPTFLEGNLKQLGAACAPSWAPSVIVLTAVQWCPAAWAYLPPWESLHQPGAGAGHPDSLLPHFLPPVQRQRPAGHQGSLLEHLKLSLTAARLRGQSLLAPARPRCDEY